MHHWRGPRGIEIEVITLDEQRLYKVTQTARQRRYLLAYCRTVREVTAWVDLADLVEVISFPAR